MLRSIDYYLQNSEKEFIICESCDNILTTIKDAEIYLKATAQGKKPAFYFVSKIWSIEQFPQERFYCNQLAIELETVPPFRLMKICKVKCAKCHAQIGIYIKSTKAKDKAWLEQRVLFQQDSVTFQSTHIRCILNQHLKDNLQEGEKIEQKEKKEEFKDSIVEEEELIKNALNNIAFYSRVLDDLKRRNEEVVALSKYQLVKSRSQKKRMSNKY